MNIYYQRQKNDLCRLHSLNAYYGYEKISEEQFQIYCNEYDLIIKGLNTKNNDGFCEGRNIISYILDKYNNTFCILIPINLYKKSRENIAIDHYNKLIKNKNITQYFEFNKGHVWFNKYIKNSWYKIDSITGVSQFDFNNIKDNGYLLIIDSYNILIELKNYIIILKKKYDEITIFNLHYLLKNIELNYHLTNSKYNSNISLLKNLKHTLEKYVLYKQQSKYIKTFEIQLQNIILNIVKLIILY